MTLRQKTLSIIAGTTVVLIGILYGTTQWLLLGSFEDLEQENARQLVTGVLNTNQQSIDQYADSWLDWSNWDDAYEFVQDSNKAFVLSNLTDGSLSTLGNNLMVFTDSSGRMVWGTMVDLKEGKRLPLTTEIRQLIRSESTVFNRKSDSELVSGFLRLSAGLMVIVSRPVLTSENKGPVMGTLTVGYYFDSEKVSELATVTQQSVIMTLVNPDSLPDPFNDMNLSTGADSIPVLKTISETEIAGYELISDLSGKPVAMFTVSIPRSIYAQGRLTLTWFITALIIVGIVIGSVIFFSFQLIVIRKVQKLTQDVTRMGRTKNLALRVEVTGEDELATLGTQINDLLSSREKDSKELENTFIQLSQSEKLASLGQMVAGLAHEINTPLGYLSSSAETLEEFATDSVTLIKRFKYIHERLMAGSLDDLDILMQQNEDLFSDIDVEHLTENNQKLIGTIKDGLNRIADLIDSLKSFSRVDPAQMKLTNVNENLETALLICQHEIKNKVQVRKDFSGLPFINAFPTQLNQVFMNLIINAAHACDEKQGRLPGYTGIVNLKTFTEDNHVKVEIQDNGTGIDPAIVSKIFDPFFTTKDIGKGTGLGLSIAYEIIRKHQGDITVLSKPGEWTSFTITLPVAENQQTETDLFS